MESVSMIPTRWRSKRFTWVLTNISSTNILTMQQIDGRIVIDTKSYLQFNANHKIDVSPLVDSEDLVQMNAQENYDNYGGTYFRTGDHYSQPQLDWNEVQSAITSKGNGVTKAKQELSDEE